MIVLDGSQGEGGGQVLRTALALSMVTGKSFQLQNVRAGRERPGLLRRHLAAVRAGAEVCGARVFGDEVGSAEVTFVPEKVRAGRYRFEVGAAGSVALTLQTVLPALMVAEGVSEIVLEGGTHHPSAPPFEFLEKCFLPLIRRMGPSVSVRLERHGLHAERSGRIVATIRPAHTLKGFELMECGGTTRQVARAMVAGPSGDLVSRELDGTHMPMAWEAERFGRRAGTAGNVLLVELKSAGVTEVITGYGRSGLTAEQMVEGVVRKVRRYLRADVPVGEYLADQLMVPLAMAGSGAYRTVRLTRHSTTNMRVIGHFLQVGIGMEEGEDGVLVWFGRE